LISTGTSGPLGGDTVAAKRSREERLSLVYRHNNSPLLSRGAVYFAEQGETADEILKCDHSNDSY